MGNSVGLADKGLSRSHVVSPGCECNSSFRALILPVDNLFVSKQIPCINLLL